MPAYLGTKQLFRNRLGGGAVREIYFGSNKVMGFNDASYIADEFIGEKAPAGDYPKITGNGTNITIGTTNYNPGYAFSKYYCDHIKIMMMYSGGLIFYDCNGNEVVNITGTISFNYLTAKWTITSTCVINGVTVLDTSYKGSDTPANRLTYEVYYDRTTKKWTLIYNGATYTGSAQEWIPTYVRIYTQFWFISSTSGITSVNGIIYVEYLNRAVGYPLART